MLAFRGLRFAMLRLHAADIYHDERVRPFVVDAIEKLERDELVAEPLVETGVGNLVDHVFWIVGVHPESATMIGMHSDAAMPASWAANAALGVRPLLHARQAALRDGRLEQLAERGITTVACLLFTRASDGGVSVLHARRPDINPKEAAALVLTLIERSLEKRHGVN